jgi:hypothetical protein
MRHKTRHPPAMCEAAQKVSSVTTQTSLISSPCSTKEPSGKVRRETARSSSLATCVESTLMRIYKTYSIFCISVTTRGRFSNKPIHNETSYLILLWHGWHICSCTQKKSIHVSKIDNGDVLCEVQPPTWPMRQYRLLFLE